MNICFRFNSLFGLIITSIITPGFQTVLQKFEQDDELLRPLQELFPSPSADEKDNKLLQPLQELFPSSSADEDEKEDTIVLLTEAYHNYKRKYVKHLTFNPKEKNLSKDLFFYQLVLNK